MYHLRMKSVNSFSSYKLSKLVPENQSKIVTVAAKVVEWFCVYRELFVNRP